MSNKLLRLARGLKPCGSPPQRHLITVLADHADDSGRCWPGIRLLEAETELSARTIMRGLRELENRGWIQIQRKSVGALHRGSAYVLNEAKLEADQLTGDRQSGDTESPVQVTDETCSGDTESPALEAPVSPIRTSAPLCVVRSKAVPPFVLEKFIPGDVWEDFEQHRISKRKPLNDAARWAAQKRLLRFHNEGQDVREIIETAIINGWLGVFPSRTKQSSYAAPSVTNPIQAIDKLRGIA